MSCTRHFLTFEWSRHTWRREVTQTESLSFRESDMWGRKFAADQVLCHAQSVCQDCGTIRDGGDCGCEPEQANQCKARLTFLARPACPAPITTTS